MIWILCLLLLLTGCNARQQQAEARAAAHQYRIGFTPGSMGNPYTQEFYACMQEHCAALDVELTCFDADNDVAKQLRAIQSWIADGYDAVICSPIEPTTLQPVIDQCMDSGIPFLNVDSECQRKTVFIGVNQYEYGYTAGKLAADWLNANCDASQTVACAILTKPQSLAVSDRANGIIEGFADVCVVLDDCVVADLQFRCTVGIEVLNVTGTQTAQRDLTPTTKRDDTLFNIRFVSSVSRYIHG